MQGNGVLLFHTQGFQLPLLSRRGKMIEDANTVAIQCHYNAVQFIMILQTVLQWQQQNVNQTLNSQQTPHTSPSRASYGVSIMRNLKKIGQVLMPPQCITLLLKISSAQLGLIMNSPQIVPRRVWQDCEENPPAGSRQGSEPYYFMMALRLAKTLRKILSQTTKPHLFHINIRQISYHKIHKYILILVSNMVDG